MTDSSVKKGYKQTEVGVIPEDWVISNLGSLTDPQRPISYGIVQTGPNLREGIPCLRVVDINNGRINKLNLIRTSKEVSNAYKRTVLKSGDLVTPLRGKVGDIGIIEGDLAGSNLTRGLGLIALSPGFYPPFFKQLLSSFQTRARLEQSMNGSALQEIPIATLRSFRIAYPGKTQEQEAIAGALSDADALIESLERLIAKKRQIKQGTMQELLTGKKRLPGFASKPGVKRTEIGDLPCDWVVEYIHEFASIKTGPFGTLLKASEYSGGEGVPLISVGEIREGCFQIAEHTPRVTKDTFRRLPQYLLKKGDIVFGRKGGVDRSALVRQQQEGWFLGSDGICVRPIKDCQSEYLALQFQSIQVKSWLLQNAIGTTMPSLNQEILGNVAIPFPPTPAEQSAIAAVLSDMDAEIAALETKLAKARQIKQGMMQELLTGRIRLV